METFSGANSRTISLAGKDVTIQFGVQQLPECTWIFLRALKCVWMFFIVVNQIMCSMICFQYQYTWPPTCYLSYDSLGFLLAYYPNG